MNEEYFFIASDVQVLYTTISDPAFEEYILRQRKNFKSKQKKFQSQIKYFHI